MAIVFVSNVKFHESGSDAICTFQLFRFVSSIGMPLNHFRHLLLVAPMTFEFSDDVNVPCLLLRYVISHSV